jgi:hypothetical protein
LIDWLIDWLVLDTKEYRSEKVIDLFVLVT